MTTLLRPDAWCLVGYLEEPGTLLSQENDKARELQEMGQDSADWIRRLVQSGRVRGIRVGPGGRRAVWLVHMPSLLKHTEDMDKLGPSKYSPS